MKSAYFTLIFVLACTCTSMAQPTDCSLSIAEPVPVNLSEVEQKDFIYRREKLEEWRLDLEIRCQAHNNQCADIDPDDWALLGDCRESKIRLEEEIGKYQEALWHYRELFKLARRGAGEDVPLFEFPEKSIKYFMLGNYFEPADFESGNRAKRVWPGPRNPEKHSMDIDAPEVEKNDKDLLQPLNHSVIDLLVLDDVIQIVRARRIAREREAMRMSTRMLAQERKRLIQEGIIKPGENIMRKEIRDPKFHRLMNEIYSSVAEKEIQNIHNATQIALIEFGDILDRRDKARDPELMRRELAERNNVRDFYNSKMREIDQRYSQNFGSEMQGLKNKGYYKEGEDLLQKDMTDLRFRQAARTAARKVCTQKRREEDSAFGMAFGELKESCYLENIQSGGSNH